MMRKWHVLLMLALILGLLSGCSALSLINGQRELDPLNPQRDPEELSVTLYFSDEQAQYVLPEQRTVLTGDEALPQVLIKELIAGPTHEGLSRTIPQETKLLGLEVREGIAYVDFSQEVVSKHWGGSAGETMTIASVVNTLTELPEITAVQFLVEGEIQEAIWGHGITSEPISRMEDLIGD